jgi:hypothetical protein
MGRTCFFVVAMLAARATAQPHGLVRGGIFSYACNRFSSPILQRLAASRFRLLAPQASPLQGAPPHTENGPSWNPLKKLFGRSGN